MHPAKKASSETSYNKWIVYQEIISDFIKINVIIKKNFVSILKNLIVVNLNLTIHYILGKIKWFDLIFFRSNIK